MEAEISRMAEPLTLAGKFSAIVDAETGPREEIERKRCQSPTYDVVAGVFSPGGSVVSGSEFVFAEVAVNYIING
jgi:hypothetical protein